MSMAEITPTRAAARPWLTGLKNLVVGSLLALMPVTAILVLGWLMRDMRRAAMAQATGVNATLPGWIAGEGDGSIVARAFGGLAQNIKDGLGTCVALGLSTLPFAGFWIASWWAGWDNSFNKGYEQAFIGPASGLAGLAIFMIMMIYIPLAQAHMAAEARLSAFFEFARVRSVFRHTGWAYVIWTAGIAFFALPVFAARGLPAFVEGLIPQFADFTPQQVNDLAMAIALVMSVYIFVSLVIFRRWQARIYAGAVRRALGGRDRAIWDGSALAHAGVRPDTRGGWQLLRPIRFLLLAGLWLFVAILIYVGQFLNHDWQVWLTHPLIFLPWMP